MEPYELTDEEMVQAVYDSLPDGLTIPVAPECIAIAKAQRKKLLGWLVDYCEDDSHPRFPIPESDVGLPFPRIACRDCMSDVLKAHEEVSDERD